MHTIELIGSYTTAATLSGEEIRITTQRKDPVPVLCRELIDRGAHPFDPVRINRSGKPVWRNDRTLSDWAGIDIADEDRAGLRTRTYRPMSKEVFRHGN